MSPTKECTKCHIVTDISEFWKGSSKGVKCVKSLCKMCKNAYERERCSQFRTEINERNREKYREKKETVSEVIFDPLVKKACSVCNIEKVETEFYADKSRGIIRSECKACASLRRKQHYQDNREKIIKQTSNYKVEKMKTNPEFKLEIRLKNRLYIALTKQFQKKNQKTMEYVGCTSTFFKEWMEFQLYDGMTMENHGKVWHIDHCKPCSLFDLSDEKQISKCFNWSNMRPFLATKNLIKHNSYNPYDSLLQEIKKYVFLRTYGSEKRSVLANKE